VSEEPGIREQCQPDLLPFCSSWVSGRENGVCPSTGGFPSDTSFAIVCTTLSVEGGLIQALADFANPSVSVLLTPLVLGYCGVVVLAAYTVRSAVGFGGGLIAIPLLALVLPVPLVVPLVTLLGLTQSVRYVSFERRSIHWPELRRLLLPSALGVLIGLYLFSALDPIWLSRALGAFLLMYVGLALFGPHSGLHADPRLVPFLAGPLGAAAAIVATLFGGMAGPIYVTYLDLARLDKNQFRATVQTILLVLAVMRMAGYIATGAIDMDALVAFGLALPAMIAGTYLGNCLHVRVSQRHFSTLVYLVLVASGTVLLTR